MRIIIVDDSNFIRETLAEILIKNNYEVVAMGKNGEEAIALYKDLTPDIVILDITMPIMDGITALKEILKVDKDAIVIICSAMGQQKIVVEAIGFGAKDFIIKPFLEDRVLQTVEQVSGNINNT